MSTGPNHRRGHARIQDNGRRGTRRDAKKIGFLVGLIFAKPGIPLPDEVHRRAAKAANWKHAQARAREEYERLWHMPVTVFLPD